MRSSTEKSGSGYSITLLRLSCGVAELSLNLLWIEVRSEFINFKLIMSNYREVYFKTQFICAVLMICVITTTLAKVVYSTMHVPLDYTVLYIVLSLGLLSWLMFLLSFYVENSFVSSVIYQTSTF